MRAGLARLEGIVIDGKSGVTGAGAQGRQIEPMYLFTERGVPVATPGVGFGSSNLAHSPNENMRLVDFENAARHLARLLVRFAGA